MKTLLTKFKGYLTYASLSAIIFDVLAVKNQIMPAFNEAADADFSVLGLVSIAGAVFGYLRKGTNIYKSS